LQRSIWHQDSENNAAYYPVIFETEEALLRAEEALKQNQIGTRRYFYPSLATALPYLNPTEMEVTDSISKRVLCLPLYYDLTDEQIIKIEKIIL